ncbi:M16 family metallopeptidase [Streptomyces sp. HUAS TT20]|uniref:M16 family metallopeptidase n=1 Tax=Streptomyces sp. HUAS TT20 TaxID=3447509 RepID=UPI0021D9C763|nr:pitrilysin family protein [Streptomyces sp. HUAS 15-9]UXY33129.1 insulinase family protein [Streptomyces sp. HUAS 15-9]
MTSTDQIHLVHALDERLRTTSICLAVAYGARHDPTGHGGLAHVLEHLLMSAPVGDVGPLVQHIESLGGSANAETGLEHMLFYAQVAAEDADEVAGLLLRSLLSPALDPGTLDAERSAVLQELAAAEADPADVVQDAFLGAIFADHPLGRPVGGTVPEITALDLDTVVRGHRERFVTAPMALAVIGPRLPRPLAGLPTERRAALAPPAPVPLGAVRAGRPAWPDTFGWVAVGGRSQGLADTNRHRYAVLANLLGGSAYSVLYQELRIAAGLAYSFQAWDRGYTEAGAWRVMIGVESGNGPKAVDIVTRELSRLADEGPTDHHLLAALRHARTSLILDTETPLEHARLLASRALRHPARWDINRELAEIAAVSATDVRRAAAELLTDPVTVVRPEAR